MYNKIFTKILDSSIWLEPASTRLVWLTLIAAMDEDGFCQFASVGNLAHRARVLEDEAQTAVASLEGPDPNSSDPENEGRRIERVPGGWMVLNAPKYRDMVTRTVARERTRLRVAKHRQKALPVTDVTPCNAVVTPPVESVTQSEAGAEAGSNSESDSSHPPVNSVSSRKHGKHPLAPKTFTDGEEVVDNIPTTENAKRIARICHRRPTTPWDEKDVKTFKGLGKITEEDLSAVEAYYAAEMDNPQNCLRRDISTFLNNFRGEVDRANGFIERAKSGPRTPAFSAFSAPMNPPPKPPAHLA